MDMSRRAPRHGCRPSNSVKQRGTRYRRAWLDQRAGTEPLFLSPDSCDLSGELRRCVGKSYIKYGLDSSSNLPYISHTFTLNACGCSTGSRPTVLSPSCL